MLKHLIPYKNTSIFICANYSLINGEPLLDYDHWIVAEEIMEFLELLHESAFTLSGIYYPNSPLMLHHIRDIVVICMSKRLIHCL